MNTLITALPLTLETPPINVQLTFPWFKKTFFLIIMAYPLPMSLKMSCRHGNNERKPLEDARFQEALFVQRLYFSLYTVTRSCALISSLCRVTDPVYPPVAS